MLKRNSLLLLLLLVITACNTKSKKEVNRLDFIRKRRVSKNYVETKLLHKGSFYHELVSNGKLLACNKVDLRFQGSEIIDKIYVKNGMHVRKGEKLAELNTFKLRHQLMKAKNSFYEAQLNLHEKLIGQGFSLEDSNKVAPRTMRVLKIKSGYENACSSLELARYAYEHAVLYAPFDGVIANLYDKEKNTPKTANFCTVIDTRSMEVKCSVLEEELGVLKVGDSVNLKPIAFPNLNVSGQISEINPLVEASGLVHIKAVVRNKEHKLYDGMNVQLSIFRSIPDQWMVPKSAVLFRDGRKILFTKENGRSVWHYVKTNLENMTSFSVIGEGLHEGDSVIVSGNFKLAHDVPVFDRLTKK